MIKKFLAFIMVLACVISLPLNIFAQEAESVYAYSNLPANIQQVLTENDYNTLPDIAKESITKYGIPSQEDTDISVAAVTDSYFIPSFGAFTFYTNGSFSQSSNTCVPVAMANALSYFDCIGRSYLISGSTMSQNEFTELCNLTGWTAATGTDLVAGLTGLATYSSRRGYAASDYAHYVQSWTNLKNNLKNDYPVFVTQNNTSGSLGHAYFVVGYKIEDGEKLLYAYTGDSSLPLMWLNFEDVDLFDRIWIE